ncbi:MAG: hypothetical protein IPQ08_00720 [Chitinophagaceae bacterium]|nr:hypothetical protein [Chitinophagaceae bacterium]
MTGIFKQKNPASIIILLVMGILIKWPIFRHPHIPVFRQGDGILFRSIFELLPSSPLLYPVLAFSLLFLQAIILNLFLNRYRMMTHATWFPAMSYMLITSLLPEWNYFSAPLLVNTILLLILMALFRIYNQPKAQGIIFNIGLGLGICSFLYFPSLSFVIWILISLAIMRPFHLREWLLGLLGVSTPFYFYAVYLIWHDQWSWSHLWPYFDLSIPMVKQTAWLAGSAFLLVVPFLSGGYYVQESLRRMLIQVRKGWSLILLYLLCSLFIPFINDGSNMENWVMAAIPLAAFHACTYLYSTYRIFPLLLFWVTLAFVLGHQYYGQGWV